LAKRKKPVKEHLLDAMHWVSLTDSCTLKVISLLLSISPIVKVRNTLKRKSFFALIFGYIVNIYRPSHFASIDFFSEFHSRFQ